MRGWSVGRGREGRKMRLCLRHQGSPLSMVTMFTFLQNKIKYYDNVQSSISYTVYTFLLNLKSSFSLSEPLVLRERNRYIERVRV